MFIDKGDLKLSICQQCALLWFNRSNLYYRHREKNLEAEHRLRKAIDRQFMDDPCGVIKNDALFTPFGPYRRREAHPPADAVDELAGDLSKATAEPETSGASNLSVPAQRRRDCPGQSGLGH